jgi:hypothetical protein
MATLKQKKVAKLVIENAQADKPLTGGQILEKTGYAPGVIKNPSDVLDSKGVQEELIRHGFNPDAAKEVVTEILYAGENDAVKLKAADMVFKVHGTYAAEKHINLNIEDKPSERLQEIADKMRKANG